MDQELDDMRSSIRNAIQEKDWAKAESQIESLLARAPNDPQAAEWRGLVAQGRKADLSLKNPSKQEGQQELELASY